MLHTANLMAPGGVVHSPIPGQPEGPAEPVVSASRPAARKSQIIEEEEDDEDIEEVDEFDDEEETGEPADVIHEDQDAETETIKELDNQVPEAGSPVSLRKPALEPAAELESSPVRPPRTSSLRSPPPEAAAAIAVVTGTTKLDSEEDTAAPVAADAVDTPTAKAD